MKISVIIPYYKTGGRIGRCLDSLQNQAGDIEIVAIDDNGELNNEDFAIAAQYIDTVRISHTERRGVSAARNSGLDIATGDWITFLDADDTWLPNAGEQLQQAIEANPDAKIIELDHLRHYVETGETRKKYALPRCAYKFGTSNRAWCFVWNKLYKADLIKDIRFVEGIQFGEDEVFNIDVLAKHNKIVHDDRFIALKRYFDNKQSLSRTKDREGLLAQNDALIDCLNRHADKPEIARSICMLIGKHWQSPTFLQKFGGGAL